MDLYWNRILTFTLRIISACAGDCAEDCAVVLCGEIGLHCANELLHNLFSRKVIVRGALGVAFSRKVIVRGLSVFLLSLVSFSIEYSSSSSSSSSSRSRSSSSRSSSSSSSGK